VANLFRAEMEKAFEGVGGRDFIIKFNYNLVAGLIKNNHHRGTKNIALILIE
jgi:hypothetical protein